MKIIYGTLLFTTLILTAYLVFSLNKMLPALQESIAESAEALKPLQQQLDKQQETITAIQAELVAFRKEINDRIAKEENRKLTLKAIQAALAKVDEAEAIHKTGDLVKAVEVLLTIKDPLWKAGDFFQADQAAFHDLMGPIDATTAQWKANNAAADTTQISIAIKTLLDKVSQP